jgi:hypothetical protein
MRVIFAATVAATFLGLFPDLAKANTNAPWCAVISLGRDSVYWDCQYSSFEQCRPNVLAGNRGFCNHNPYYAYQPAERRRHRKH